MLSTVNSSELGSSPDKPSNAETVATWDLSLDDRSVILKIHGAVDRSSPDGEDDSFVITEDHYIDYLTRTDLANLVPITLAAKLRRSHFLFLGYSLRDWNLRVILHRIAGALCGIEIPVVWSQHIGDGEPEESNPRPADYENG